MAVIEDIIEGTMTNTPEGIQATRVFHITGLGIFAGARKQYEALQVSGMPRMFDPHPFVPNCFIVNQSVDVVENSPDQARVTCEYGPPDFQQQEPSESPDAAQISVGATVQSTTTEVDVDGNALETTITIETKNDDGTVDTETITDINQVDVLVPETVVEFERREPSSPLGKASQYVGKVNSVDIGVFGSGTLLCLGIEGRTDNNNQTFSVVYRFQYKPDSWQAEVAYIDPDTDRIHPQVTRNPPNGFARYQVYQSADFRILNLPW